MTFEAYLKLWLDTYITPKRARHTVDCYRYALAHLSDHVRRRELTELHPIELQREINTLAAMYSRQAQLLHCVLRASLRRAVWLHMLEHSPMDGVEPPSHEKREIDVMTRDEAAAYLEAAQHGQHGALLALMLCLGLRRNEARALMPGSLDGDGILHVRQQRIGDQLAPLKSRSSRREIPVPEALRSFFAGPDGEFLDPCSENTLRRAHLAALKAAGITRRITLHGLRHTCATLAIENGSELVTVQRLLGHRHFSLTADIYVHPDRRLLTVCTALIYNSVGRFGARLEIV